MRRKKTYVVDEPDIGETTVLCWLSPLPYACGRDAAREGCVLDSPATMTRTSALR
jgi:hypothetical protein